MIYRRRIRGFPGYELVIVHLAAADPCGGPPVGLLEADPGEPEDDPGEDGEGDR